MTTGGESFGIVVRADGKGGGYALRASAQPGQRQWRRVRTGRRIAQIYDLHGYWTGNQISQRFVAGQLFDPGAAWHTYRVEAKGNVSTFLVDDTPLATVTDNKHLEPGQVGLWCDGYQIEVRSFEVMPI
jgi:hypothetical protein